jgi:pilus assembly protein Flp/PilA
MLNFLVGLQFRMIGLQSRAIGALHREEGQGLTEYALILGLVAIVAIAALALLGKEIVSKLGEVTNGL